MAEDCDDILVLVLLHGVLVGIGIVSRGVIQYLNNILLISLITSSGLPFMLTRAVPAS